MSLSPLETFYLSDSGRIRLDARGRTDVRQRLLRMALADHPRPEVVALVYRDMRSRGLVVLEDGPGRLKVLPRGGTPKTSSSRTLLLPVAERDEITFAAALELARDGQGRRKRVNIGVADAESDVTYYAPNLPRLPDPAVEGASGRGASDHDRAPIPVVLFGNRATASGEGVGSLRAEGWYGKVIGDLLHLSLLETIHLLTTGRIALTSGETGRKVGQASLLRRAKEQITDLEARLQVYSDLRSRGMLVKTGFKYGTHFRVYAGDPEENHARWLVQVVARDQGMAWWELSRGVRLAHGVRKEILWAAPNASGVDYLKLGWVRP